jgi:hypothetical protein
MSPLARGPGKAGDRQQANASKSRRPFCPQIVVPAGGEGMTYLTRGPSLLGIDSKAHASSEPTPFCVQIVNASGGDSMRSLVTTTSTIPDFQTLLQAAP